MCSSDLRKHGEVLGCIEVDYQTEEYRAKCVVLISIEYVEMSISATEQMRQNGERMIEESRK